MKRIEITVTPDGRTEVTTQGFTGEACRQASRRLEEALGQPTGEKLTAEYYVRPTVAGQLRENS